MRVWALYSTYVDPYSEPELIELFTLQSDAEQAVEGLSGKPRSQAQNGWTSSAALWDISDDEFPDLYIKPLELR